MSRVTVHGPRYSLSYGVDHDPFIGAFVMVWDRQICLDAANESVVVDRDGISGRRVTVEEIATVGADFDVPIDIEAVRRELALRPEPIRRAPKLQDICDKLLAETRRRVKGDK